MAPVWTEWVDIAAIVPLDSQERDVRETLTSVSLTPAIPQTVLTASSCPMITNVSASLASQVRQLEAAPASQCKCKNTLLKLLSFTINMLCLGRRCQGRFSVCESQPCQNGGACTVSSSFPLGYTCTCQLVSIHSH